MDIKQQAAYDKVMAEYDAILEMAKQKLTEPDGWCFYFPKGLAMKFPNGKPQVCLYRHDVLGWSDTTHPTKRICQVNTIRPSIPGYRSHIGSPR